jgi:hypothetical protein
VPHRSRCRPTHGVQPWRVARGAAQDVFRLPGPCYLR